jgi:lipopolysaccharide/colanic/teichoic acid biosynthesis glycosyltransferase
MSSLKRAFDVAGAAGGLLAFSPVMLLAAAAILLDDGRPLRFRQPRLGRRRRPFGILKFRTMRDGRVTRAGRVLRATGLDELPQFLNILAGDMSAVGPRPLTDEDVRRYGWTGAAFDFRFDVRPRLTGLAQLVGPPTPGDALALDQRYLESPALWLDCSVVALSFAVNVFGKARVQHWLRHSSFAAGGRRRTAVRR